MTKVEDKLKALLLQDVEFVIDNKIIKKGKIKMFNTKQFFLKFKIECAASTKEYEIPYPFRVENTSNGYLFDYTLSAMIPPTEPLYWKIKLMNKDGASKLYNNYLFVRATSAVDK